MWKEHSKNEWMINKMLVSILLGCEKSIKKHSQEFYSKFKFETPGVEQILTIKAHGYVFC